MRQLVVLIFIFNLFNLQAQDNYQFGAEVYIEQGQTPQQVDNWIKMLADHHMPVARIFIMWNQIELKAGQWDFSLYDQVFSSAEKYGVKIVATLTMNYEPYYVNPTGFYILHENALPRTAHQLNYSKKYIEKVVNRYKNSKALDTWWLINEPGMNNRDDSLAVDRFKIWLSKKYGTIDSLNSAWHCGFKSFPSIQYDASWNNNSYWTWPIAYYDWHEFWGEHLTWYLKWVADNVKFFDSKHDIHVNPHSFFDNISGYKLYTWRPFLSSLGCSMHPSGHLHMYPRNLFPEGISWSCDLVRGAIEPKPFWVSELQGGNNIYSGKNPLCTTPEELANWIWTAKGAGSDRIIMWSLNYRKQGNESGEWALVNFLNEPSERMLKVEEISNIIQANDSFFKNAKPYASPITILYSPRSVIMQNRREMRFGNYEGRKHTAHMKAVLGMYRAFANLGIPINVKDINDFNWNDSLKHQTLLLPHITCLSDELIHKIKQFTKAGNDLFVTGFTGFFDNYEKMRIVNEDFILQDLFGATVKEIFEYNEQFDMDIDNCQNIPAHMWITEIKNIDAKVTGWKDDKIISVDHKYGKGDVFWCPSLIDLSSWLYSSRPIELLLSKKYKRITDQLPFKFEGSNSEIIFRLLHSGDDYVTILVNESDKKQSIKWSYPGNLHPRIIYGDQQKIEHTIILEPSKTLVIMWGNGSTN